MDLYRQIYSECFAYMEDAEKATNPMFRGET